LGITFLRQGVDKLLKKAYNKHDQHGHSSLALNLGKSAEIWHCLADLIGHLAGVLN
jgi:hypothetical protein